MKTFLCVVRRVLAVLLALIFALLGAACLIAIPLSNNYSAMISMAVAMPTTAKSGGSNPQYFTSDYSSAAAVQEASAQLCREIEQEGMVLLRNNGDALPLAKGASVTRRRGQRGHLHCAQPAAGDGGRRLYRQPGAVGLLHHRRGCLL